MIFGQAYPDEFDLIKQFYWNLIDEMKEQNDKIGWKKGIYPTDDFLKVSLRKGELFTLKENDRLCACVILNSAANEGYQGIPWSQECLADQVLIPHALAVSPSRQGCGVGKRIVEEILKYARLQGKKAVRLDILGTNSVAEKFSYWKCAAS